MDLNMVILPFPDPFVFLMLWIEPSALLILSKPSTTELSPTSTPHFNLIEPLI